MIRTGLRRRRRGTIPALPIKVVSTHGAGDTFVGSLAADLARGVDVARALDQANRAAAPLVSSMVVPS